METLLLTEIFASVQGETHLTGLPTTFIRLSGCNLRCSWCDTPYSFPKGNKTSFEEIFQKVEDFGCSHICVTGGEPLLQKNVFKLISALCDKGYAVSVETGGSLSTEEIDHRATIILDIKCPGSGMEKKNHLENLSRLRDHDRVKFVLLDRKDYDFAVDFMREYALSEPLFSPVHGKLEARALVEWILADRLAVRLNLQTHKYIWSPETKGV